MKIIGECWSSWTHSKTFYNTFQHCWPIVGRQKSSSVDGAVGEFTSQERTYTFGESEGGIVVRERAMGVKVDECQEIVI